MAENPKHAFGLSKPCLSAVPIPPLMEAAMGMGEGAWKYGRHNYRHTRIYASIYFDAVMRHMFAWWEGEDTDPDSGLHHVTKALCSLLVLRDAQIRGMDEDDRPPRSEAEWLNEMTKVWRERQAKFLNQYGATKPPHTEK